jgi:6-phosphogluconolactonase
VTLDVEVLPDADAVATAAAEVIAALVRDRVAAAGRCTIAVSGGRTPWAMLRAVAHDDVPWDRVATYQVDERVAPDGDPDRNLTHLLDALPAAALDGVHAMPVGDDDLEAAAARYADSLPPTFDVIHLGLGPDGHTASLVPGDPVLEVADRDVALTDPYQGHRRMTLTYPVLDRAASLLWLVTGAEKAEAVRLLRAHDPSIPAGRVRADTQRLLCDAAAAGA